MSFRSAFAIAACAVALVTAPLAANAQRYGGSVPPPGPYRGGAVGVQGGAGWSGGTWSGGTWSGGAWRAPAPAWGWGGSVAWGRPAWGWGGGVAWGRPAWGWGGWGWGWGPGWAWGPGWGWGGWGWSASWTTPVVVAPAVTGAWVLPPTAAATTVFIERSTTESAPPAPAAQQWWYWCESARAYYPYVESCAEGWRRIEPRTPPQ